MKIIFIAIAFAAFFAGSAQTQFNVYFDFNKHDLTLDARSKLDSFLQAEKQNLSALTITLSGHCDSIGSHIYNNKLSANRLAAVKHYLINKSIQPGGFGDLSVMGEKDPLYENKTDEGRQLNRRVTINITKTEDSRTLAEKIGDTATIAGTNIVLKNMNYFGGSPYLLPQSFSILDELLEIMKRNPALVIEIQGHICCVAYADDSPYGNTGSGLSEERARTIWAHLIGNGIGQDRVSYKGYGHSQPIYPYPEKSEYERIQNRRVELKIIRK